MKANPRFVSQPKEFWAYVRTISQELGYTERNYQGGHNTISVPSLAKIIYSFNKINLSTRHIQEHPSPLTPFGIDLLDYFGYRANVLNNTVHGYLMKKDEAEAEFQQLYARLKPSCPLPFNKQKGEKRNYAFLTGMVNMLVEAHIGNVPCDYDPRSLTTITHNDMPLRTLSRRVDGAFPSVINPIVIWEIKEYYYTTTFGSRVADGVYETLLDGLELEELEASAKRKVQHLLIVDDYFTWWECGRSYLCRIIDMLHMGYVDEVLFGREVITRLPELAQEWKEIYENGRNQSKKQLT